MTGLRTWRAVLMGGALALLATAAQAGNGVVVYQSDFGVKDGAVSAMKGVAIGIDKDLRLFDLTHEIPAFNIWEGAYRLLQTAPYWPAETVFVSVVDPGVGTDRLPVVAKLKSGQFIVTPDNGTLTLLADRIGIDAVRVIDESRHRLAGSADSATFHGRDVFSAVAARLAANALKFEDIGDELAVAKLIRIDYRKAEINGNVADGNIPVLDIQYGNIWTNIDKSLLESWALKKGDRLKVTMFKDGKRVYSGFIPFANSFGDVPNGYPLAYFNSLRQLSLAINMGSFAAHHRISSGSGWSVHVEKP